MIDLPCRRRRRRVHGAAALFAVLAAAVPGRAQRVPARIEARPIEFVTGEDDNLFSLQRSQQDIHEWELGLQELAAGDAAAAVERLHRLLQNESGGVVPIAPGRFLGLRLAVLTTMANLPPAAAEAYAALARRQAGGLGERPLPELEPEQVELLAARFPAAPLGRKARLRLGDLALTAGDGLRAADHFRQALDATAIGSRDERLVVERLHAADVLTHPAAARAAAAAPRPAAAGGDVLAVLPTATTSGFPGLGSGGGRTPMSEPAGRPRAVVTEDLVAPGFDRREVGQFAMFPVGDLDGIYVNTGRELIAFDPLRGGPAWISPSPLQDAGRLRDNPAENVNTGMVLAAALGGDVVVAALQVPDTSVNVDFQASFRIISKIPQRRLFAFSRRSGKLLWSHFDGLDGARTRRFRGHDACAPPLVVGDTVYAPVHDRSGAIAFSVAAYDLATGEPKWRRLVCSSQQDVNMFGNALLEFAAGPLAASDGVLYGASNLGVAYAIELATGRLRWLTAYEVVSMPRTMLHGQAERPVYFANNAPAVADGVVCCTPLDSQYVLGLDAETGAPLWRLSADASLGGTENRVRWLAGALDDEFVLAGRGAVAVTARPANGGGKAAARQLVRPEVLRQRGDAGGSARPALTADHVWFADGNRVLGFDRAGNPAELPPIALPHHHAGNLLLADGLVVSLRQRAFDVLLDPVALVGRVEAALAAAEDDPAAILRLCRLRSALTGGNTPPDAGATETATLTALFRRGLEACRRQGLPTAHPVHQALRRELFEHLLAAAEVARRLGEADAAARLLAARDAAPDARAFVRAQALVLDLGRDRVAQRRVELDHLERAAPDELFPVGAGIPVPAYVAWQRALLPDLTPAAAVAAWQDLLERHGATRLDGDSAAATAAAAIARLLADHGPAVYAPIERRAAAALAAAGDDAAALREVGSRFPNAEAARAARLRLLDSSVRGGDLQVAAEVLAQGLRSGSVPPGIWRRVGVAAAVRGNHALAAAMLDRLLPHAGERSDWPEDGGATYGTVRERLRPGLATAPPPVPGRPTRERARIPSRSPRQPLRLVPQLHADGFAAPAQAVLLCSTGTELLAFDPLATAGQNPLLWSMPVEFLDHTIVCGEVLVVPDLRRVVGLDLRRGTLLWELDDPPRPLGDAQDLTQYDSLGAQDGIVQFVARTAVRVDDSWLVGVEPLSGCVLYRTQLPGEAEKPMPKAAAGRLLALEPRADGGARLHDFDPVTGLRRRTTEVAAATLQQHLGLASGAPSSWLLPQGLSADAERAFLPLDANAAGESPRVVAIDGTGAVAWIWRGNPGCQLRLLQRGDRLVVVEGHERLSGRILVLAAADGRVLREAQLGSDPTLLNWQRTWAWQPAPPILALSDRPDRNAAPRRFVAFAIDDDQPSFEFALANDDGDVEPQPLFGDGIVTFGVRSARRGGLRLYTLHLADRSGALPGGARHQRVDLRSAQHQVAALGPYTVVAGTDAIVVLGPHEELR
ncbi:MAG: PQQ-like beta-propeller repeat protein [Planctomycetes bacterium]|nr:PQQ-like beta-propeller repeat protein [Planctomycetota bacterium]